MAVYKRKILIVIASVAVIIISNYLGAWLDSPEVVEYLEGTNLKVVYLDVGQGDATLLRTGQGQNILIDGGPDLSVIYELGKYLPWYEKKIDLLVLTHPDQDHLFGLIEVVERYEIGKVLLTGIADDSQIYQEWLQLLKYYDIELVYAQTNQRYDFIDLKLLVLYPFENIKGQIPLDNNDTSIVIKASYYDIDFIFTGDLSTEMEAELLKQNIDLTAEVLKAGHHGSKTSNNVDFISAVDPDYVVISSGKDNPYGHPHFRVLRNIRKVGAQIYRTDQSGSVFFETNGDRIWLD